MKTLTEAQKKKYTITQEKYDKTMRRLLSLEIEEDLCDSVILNRGRVLTVASLESEIDNLRKLGFNNKQIIQIANNTPSQENIDAVKNSFIELSSSPFNFTNEEITKIVKHNGGYKNIESVKINFNRLINSPFGFIKEEIVKIVNTNGGHENIKSLIENFKLLSNAPYNFTKQQILNVVANSGGSLAINSLKDEFTKLSSEPYKFTKKQILKLVGCGGAQNNIDSVKSAFKDLQSLNITNDQIIKIAGNGGGSKSIDSVINAITEIRAIPLNAEHIVKIVGRRSRSCNMDAIKKHYEALKAFQFTADYIAEIAGNNDGYKFIDMIAEHAELLAKVPNPAELFKNYINITPQDKINSEPFKKYIESAIQENFLHATSGILLSIASPIKIFSGADPANTSTVVPVSAQLNDNDDLPSSSSGASISNGIQSKHYTQSLLFSSNSQNIAVETNAVTTTTTSSNNAIADFKSQIEKLTKLYELKSNQLILANETIASLQEELKLLKSLSISGGKRELDGSDNDEQKKRFRPT